MLRQFVPIAAMMEVPPIPASFTHDYLAYQPIQQSTSHDGNLLLSSNQCPTSVLHPSHRTPSFGTPLSRSLLSNSPVIAIPSDQAIGPTESDRVTRKPKRCALACQNCRSKKTGCDGTTPCTNCANFDLRCEYERPILGKTSSVVDVVKDQCLALSGQIEILAMAKQTAKLSSKRKRSVSAGVGLEEESSASITLTTNTIDSPPEVNEHYQRCLTKHHLCAPPKDWSNSEHMHYFIHGFIPGRSVTHNHSFSDLLRHQHIATLKMMMPALTTLYLDQIKVSFVENEGRRKLDRLVCETLVGLWKPSPLVDPTGVLYFTLLAYQYMIIRPRLRKFWSHTAVPSLRSESSRQILLRYGNLGLRLKIHSHWIFSDIAHILYPGQPRRFLQLDETDIDIIDPLVGLSPKLLSIYACATMETFEQQPLQSFDLLRDLTQLTQCMPFMEDSSTRENEILKSCADAYLEGAYIYLLCRRQKLPVSDPQVKYHRDRLRQLLDLDILPLSGHLYRAVWPLLPAFILCVTCHDEEERHTLREGIVQELHQSASYSNIPPALDAISRVWFDETLDMQVEGWWETMVALIGNERISLT